MLLTLRAQNRSQCGAKAANLGEIQSAWLAGVIVPDGFCIPFAAYADFMRGNGLAERIARMRQQPGFATDAGVRRQALSALQAEIEQWPVSPPVADAWAKRWASQLGSQGVFVRSSSSSEDLPGFSGAGLYTTVPNVRSSADLAAAVRKVWASVYNFEAWEARLHPSATPRVRINTAYAGIVSRGGSHALSEQLSQAHWLIRSIEQRASTIERTAQAIVARQQRYFEYGEIGMQPMRLADVAQDVGIHESTVSRVVNSKYLQCPRGLVRLKTFFTSHVETNSGDACHPVPGPTLPDSSSSARKSWPTKGLPPSCSASHAAASTAATPVPSDIMRAGGSASAMARQGLTATIASISTAAPSGSTATPTALRAWRPASPNKDSISSDAPFATFG